jgi:hypothetical protein
MWARERRAKMRFEDTWQPSARLGAKYQSQTTYLMLVEMARAVDQSFKGAASVMIDCEKVSPA